MTVESVCSVVLQFPSMIFLRGPLLTLVEVLTHWILPGVLTQQSFVAFVPLQEPGVIAVDGKHLGEGASGSFPNFIFMSSEQCCVRPYRIWKWLTGITKPIFPLNFSFGSGWVVEYKIKSLQTDRGLELKRDGRLGVTQLEWFLFFSLFLKKCTCLWYCFSSEMITPPLLYWYNIVHARVVFLYSSLKFINLYCRCYVFLWQKKIKSSNFLKFF